MTDNKTDLLEMLKGLTNLIENMIDEPDDQLIFNSVDENVTNLVNGLLEKFGTKEESSFGRAIVIPFSEAISKMTPEELIARDKESCERQNKLRSSIPNDLVPMRTDLEDFLILASSKSTLVEQDVPRMSVDISDAAKELLAGLSKATPEQKEELMQYYMNFEGI